MYELIDFNGFLNMQVANFTGLIATFRFPTATKANQSANCQFSAGAASH
jgi:hypothetical protein